MVLNVPTFFIQRKCYGMIKKISATKIFFYNFQIDSSTLFIKNETCCITYGRFSNKSSAEGL